MNQNGHQEAPGELCVVGSPSSSTVRPGWYDRVIEAALTDFSGTSFGHTLRIHADFVQEANDARLGS